MAEAIVSGALLRIAQDAVCLRASLNLSSQVGSSG
jgi:hypothetical protein